jgi:hypothetical protein
MKRLLLLISVFLTIFSNLSNAQKLTYGIQLLGGTSNVSYQHSSTLVLMNERKPIFSYGVGIFAKYELYKGEMLTNKDALYIGSELSYNKRGANFYFPGSSTFSLPAQDQYVVTHYLDIPLTVHYTIYEKGGIYGGLQYSFPLDSKSPMPDFYLDKRDIGLIWGAEVKIYKGLGLGVRQIRGTKNVYKHHPNSLEYPDARTSWSFKNRQWLLTLSYTFKGKKA